MSEEYRMGRERRYMTDEELEALIAEVEDHEMLAPPAYLKELIMEEAENFIKSTRKKRIDKKTAKIQFIIYSAKIIGAAAVALFCLTMVPLDLGGKMPEAGNQWRERIIEEDMECYQKESERMRNELEEGANGFDGFWKKVLGEEKMGTAAAIWNGMSGWFGMEERDYE